MVQTCAAAGEWKCITTDGGKTTNDIRTAKRYFDEAYGEAALYAKPFQIYMVTCRGLSFGWQNNNNFDEQREESNARNIARDAPLESTKETGNFCTFGTSTGTDRTYLFGSSDYVSCSDDSFGGGLDGGTCVSRGCAEE